MRNLFFIVWVALMVVSMVMASVDGAALKWEIISCLGVALLLMILFYRMTVLPGRVVSRGFELLEAQDFNNRLVEVGEGTADRTVRLFNTMIDRLRNERLLNMERESFLQFLIDASPMGVVMLDLDGRVSMANGAFLQLCGIREYEELDGKTLEELPPNLSRWLSGIPYQESVVFRPGDSRLFKGSHLSFVQNGFNRHFFLLENLTEEMIRAERKAYEKVIRIMSHEVNNTMGGVRTVFGMLIDDTEDDKELRDVLESCDRRCGEVCDFINAYADVVRLPSPQLQRLDLGDMLSENIPFLNTLAPEDVRIGLSTEGDLTMTGDRTQLEQVIVNIVKNAVESFRDSEKDYTVEGKWIEISARSEDRSLILDISNNGKPIPESVASQLFSPFFTTKPEGKGLGLTLTGEILGSHNARWSLQTREDGITVFSIRFLGVRH
ncbi:MAG: PAS domain-containing protein [Muribaculaceae bacterium]|nr:PAS domain-containing protein [Muribaculaceae bacterium]